MLLLEISSTGVSSKALPLGHDSLIQYKGIGLMGKYVGYVILILLILFTIEFLGIVNIPILNIPDYFSGKDDMIEKTEKAMEQLN
jgi:hypothetical protein